MTRANFLEACSSDAMRRFFAQLLDDADGSPLTEVVWNDQSFTIWADWRGQRVQLFYGYPPGGFRGNPQAEIHAYLHPPLPANLCAWAREQYTLAGLEERDDAEYTLKLCLADQQLDPAERAVEVLWKLMARLE